MAVLISTRVSRLGRLTTLVLGVLLGWVVLRFPFAPVSWLSLLLLGLGGRYWWFNFTSAAPRAIELQTDQVWVINARGQRYLVRLPPLCWSVHWIALDLPTRPWLGRQWLIWPDSLSAEAHRELRVALKQRATSAAG